MSKKYNKAYMNSSYIQSCRNITFVTTNVKAFKEKYDKRIDRTYISFWPIWREENIEILDVADKDDAEPGDEEATASPLCPVDKAESASQREKKVEENLDQNFKHCDSVWSFFGKNKMKKYLLD